MEAVIEATTPATLQPFKDIMEPFMQTGSVPRVFVCGCNGCHGNHLVQMAA